MVTIGDEEVSVPNYFYKIIARNENNELKVIAFLFRNKASSKPLKTFLVSIDELERKTGLDFFEKLPEDLEERLEAKISAKNWKF